MKYVVAAGIILAGWMTVAFSALTFIPRAIEGVEEDDEF